MCPVCLEPLIVFELDGIEIDQCSRCSGTWLDSGEMELMLGEGSGTDAFCAALDGGVAEGGLRSRCPRCGRRLVALCLSGGSGIRLGRCPGGDGLWCGESEMRAVVARYARGSAVAGFVAGMCGAGDPN